MTRSEETTTVGAQVSDSLYRRFSRAVDETNTSKSAVIRDAIQSFVSDVEGDTPSAIEDKIDDLREERERIEEEKQSLESSLSSTESRISDLEDRLSEMRSQGDVDELREDLVSSVQAGADLSVVDEKTDKVEAYRRLAGFDSVYEAMDDIEKRAAESNSGGRQ